MFLTNLFFESIRSLCSLNEPNDSEKGLFTLMNEFEQESHKHASQNRARQAFELIKLKLCFCFFKWAIVSLDKTLIHYLVSFKALWTVCSLYCWTLNRLVPIEVHYMEKNPGMFSSKTLISIPTEERMTWTSWMTWGWVNNQFFQKWTTPLSLLRSSQISVLSLDKLKLHFISLL